MWARMHGSAEHGYVPDVTESESHAQHNNLVGDFCADWSLTYTDV